MMTALKAPHFRNCERHETDEQPLRLCSGVLTHNTFEIDTQCEALQDDHDRFATAMRPADMCGVEQA